MAHTTTIKGSNWLSSAWQLVSELGNPLNAIVRAGRRQRQIDELAKLDNHLLEDIGLTRGDVIAYAGPDKNHIEALCNLR
ncbi:MAG: DUF1127 domain-containing protein [Pseudomonadota bacterium]